MGNYICAYTVKTFGILKVNNALVNCAHYVRQVRGLVFEAEIYKLFKACDVFFVSLL